MIFTLKTIMIQKNYEMYYRNVNMENGYAFAGANAFKATKIMSVKETFRSLLEEFNRTK